MQYSIGSFLRIPEKAELALSLFEPRSPQLATASVAPLPVPSLRPLRINFLSAATLLTAFPFICAKGWGKPGWLGLGFKGMNQRVLEGMLDRCPEGEAEGGGMAVLMDFWETPAGLVELLIAWNMRLKQ